MTSRFTLLRAVSPRIDLDRRTNRLGAWAATAIIGSFVLNGNALAIPSPDVMVNLFASAAQVLGLVSILLGRWFFVNRGRRGTNSGGGRGYKLAFVTCAVLFCVTSAGWYLYYAAVRDENLARIQVNLNRNSREEGKKIVDVSLKELSFSDQQKRTDGVTTEEFSRELASGKALQVIDVRESEEYEVGAIQGTRAVRFPDLLAKPESYIDRGRGVTLLCFNGNRSSELAAHFEELGYACRFLIGGYEKWIAEDRPLEMRGDYARQDLREIPDYVNKNILLDTPDVVALMETREPLFLDVRYPGDFDVSHLPGAVNIPMRKLTTSELDAQIASLPKNRPVVVPCYDKRSSFFGLVIGLRLTRAGYEFLGRYTTPEGFSVPGKDKSHVAAWKAAREPKSLLSIVAEPMKGVLVWLREHIGTLALSIVLLVVLIRVAIAPLTLKGERDRRVQRRLKPELAALKARLDGDGQAYGTAASRLLSEHGVRPVWNLLATLAQLFLFTAFFSVVQQAATGSTESFLWLDALGAPDATRSLPIAVGVLLAAQVLISAGRPFARWILVVAPVAAIGIAALTWSLSAGVNLYLTVNLLLLVAQTWLFGVVEARLSTRKERRHARIATRYRNANVIPLRFAHIVPGCGNKAVRLGRSIEAGLQVPDGFVVRAQAVDARSRNGRFSPDDASAIVDAHKALGAERVAVRSSGLNEDGADKSYAGVFESILDVREESLFEALEEVADSLTSARTAAYSSEESEAGAIVVQAMVPAAWAGVLFTVHPGESGSSAVEMIEGLGDALVSGRAQPRAFRLGRITGRVLDGATPPIALDALFQLGMRAEALFGKPQDIEWAFAGGKFHLLQARDITRSCQSGEDERALKERERSKLLELGRGAERDEVVLAQNELSELLPRPTPFSLAFMDSLWAYDGSAHRAMRSLGIPYDVTPDSPPFAVSVFDVLYVNKREERNRLKRGPSSIAAFRLSRAAEEMERAWREDFLPGELRAARLRDVLDLGKLSVDELVALFVERRADFTTRAYVRAEEINVAADFYMKSALTALEKRGMDPATLLAHIPRTIVHEAFELLGRVGRGEARTSEFIDLFGHRAPLDYELAAPRYSESPELVATLAERSKTPHSSAVEAPPIPEGGVLALSVQRARNWQALKEEAKHHALRDLAFLRRVLVAIGARIGIDDGIFELTPDEVARLADHSFRAHEAARIVERRRDTHAALAAVQLPAELTLERLEELDLDKGGIIPRGPKSGVVKGMRVSGTGGAVGRARVLRHAEEVAQFQKGEILVARFTDPSWMTVFPLANGIVTEVGGWLSHAAIQAREYGITAIVGVNDALASIQTGDLLVLSPDGSVERIDERRTEIRLALACEVQVQRATGTADGRLRDVSSRGALLVVPGTRLEIGEHLSLDLRRGDVLAARVVRNGVPGIYGLELATSVDPHAFAAQ